MLDERAACWTSVLRVGRACCVLDERPACWMSMTCVG